MKNDNFKTLFKRFYGATTKFLVCIPGIVLSIHLALEFEWINKIFRMAFTSGVIMLVVGLIASGIYRYAALVRKGKRQEEAEKNGREQENAANAKKLEKAEASQEEQRAEKQHELYVRRMFREIA